MNEIIETWPLLVLCAVYLAGAGFTFGRLHEAGGRIDVFDGVLNVVIAILWPASWTLAWASAAPAWWRRMHRRVRRSW